MADVKDFMLTDDMTLDEIEDLPSFECWPSGMYNIVLNDGVLEETINEHPTFKIPMTLQEIVGIPDEAVKDEEKPKPGAELELLFMRDNKFGAGGYKAFMAPISKKFGVTKVSEMNAAAKGVQLTIVLLKREGTKENKGKFYPKVMDSMVR